MSKIINLVLHGKWICGSHPEKSKIVEIAKVLKCYDQFAPFENTF